MTRASFLGAAPAIVLAALMLAPFHDKAFTIDDTIYLLQARRAMADPLHPTAFDIAWEDVPTRVSLVNGPVMAWLLVPSVAAGGEEWMAHAVVVGMLLIALYATVALGLRLGLEPGSAMAAGLLLAATPAVLAMAGTVMPDVPAMALGTLGLERLVAWRQERRAVDGVLAAILLGLAPFARPHTIVLAGIGALLLVGDVLVPARWRESRWTTWLPLVAVPIVTLSLVLLMRDPDPGGGIASAPAQLSSARFIVPNLVAFLAHWSMTFPLALPWILLRRLEMFRRWWVPLLGAVAAGFAIAITGRGPLALAPVVGASVAVLWDVLADAVKRRDSVQLTLGLWLLVPLAPAPYPHLPSKYLLAAAPAAALLVARAAAERPARTARLTLGIAIALGIALGVAILRADAAFADVGRRAARELIAPSVAAGHRVWFSGHWGFQWYAERAGARPVTAVGPFPVEGDLVVEPLNTDAGERVKRLLRSYPRKTILGYVEDARPGGRVMSRNRGAGFYSNLWGFLPWAWDDDVLDAFVLYRIE